MLIVIPNDNFINLINTDEGLNYANKKTRIKLSAHK